MKLTKKMNINEVDNLSQWYHNYPTNSLFAPKTYTAEITYPPTSSHFHNLLRIFYFYCKQRAEAREGMSPWLFSAYTDGVVRKVNNKIQVSGLKVIWQDHAAWFISQVQFSDVTTLVSDIAEQPRRHPLSRLSTLFTVKVKNTHITSYPNTCGSLFMQTFYVRQKLFLMLHRSPAFATTSLSSL